MISTCRRMLQLLLLGRMFSRTVSFLGLATFLQPTPPPSSSAAIFVPFHRPQQRRPRPSSPGLYMFGRSPKTTSIELGVLALDEETIKSLFAWICCALNDYENDARYNNLMLAFAATFGTNVPPDSVPATLLRKARAQWVNGVPTHQRMGVPLSQLEREEASLGAMGAAQWLGQWRTRPHALLQTKYYATIEDWERSLSRGCRRTLVRSLQQNFTVTAHAIGNNAPAPHSTMDHFRCVVEHEVRLLASENDMNSFLSALSAGISRYMGTTQMAGEIREYRDADTNRVLAFAHEVRKGRTLRGQWFYGTDEASRRYMWFHSVRSCVERAIADDGLDVVDLGPSGSDAFSDLKAKYGFCSVVDWPSVADYSGPFWDYERNAPAMNGLTY